jgi:hypothetical protein
VFILQKKDSPAREIAGKCCFCAWIAAGVGRVEGSCAERRNQKMESAGSRKPMQKSGVQCGDLEFNTETRSLLQKYRLNTGCRNPAW